MNSNIMEVDDPLSEKPKEPTNSTNVIEIEDFYGIPSENTAPLERTTDIPLVPHWAEKLYDNKLLEQEALNDALGGSYQGELIFGNTVRDAFIADDIGRSKSIPDKKTKFQKAYPDGEIKTVPYNGKLVLIARKNSGAKWSKFSYVTDELTPELASFATAGSIAGEALGAGKVPFVGGPLGAAAGFAAGKALDIGLESLRGYGDGISSLASKETALGAAANAAFSFVSRGMLVGGVVAKATQPGKIPPRVSDAIAFADKEGLPAITRGQSTSNPQVESIFSQVASIDETTRLKVVEQNVKAVEKYLQFAQKNNFAGVDKKALQGLIDKEKYNLNSLLSGIKRKEMSPEEASQLLQSSFDNWERLVDGKGGYLDTLYKKAIESSEDIAFDLAPVHTEVTKMRQGVLGKGEGKAVPSTILDASGKPISYSTVFDDVRITEDPQGALGQAMDSLLELNPVITAYNAKNGSMASSFEQIKELRTRFRRLSTSNDPGVAGPAKRIHNMLTESMERGYDMGGDAARTAEFQKLWKDASKQYRSFNELADLKVISKITDMEAGDYYSVINNLMAPGKSEALKLIGNVVPDGQKLLQKVFATKLMAGTRTGEWKDTITQELDKFAKANDQATLDYLLPPAERDVLKNYAEGMNRLEGSYLNKIATFDRDASATAWEAVSSGTPEDLKYIVDLAGGINTSTGQALTRGVLTRLYQNTTTNIPKFGDAFMYEKFKDELNKLENRGITNLLFSKDQMEFLRNLDKYVDVVQLKGNVGASMQAGEQSGQAIRYTVEGPAAIAEGKGGKQLMKVVKLPIAAAAAGRFLAQPAQARFGLTAGGKKVSAYRWAALGVASMLGQEGPSEEPTTLDEYEFINPGVTPAFGE